MLNLFIRIIRIPIAIPASIVVFIVMLFAFIIETPFALSWLVVLSVISDKEGIHDSWVGSYPNSTRNIIAIIANVFIWAWNPDSEYEYYCIEYPKKVSEKVSAIFNIISVGLIFFIGIYLLFHDHDCCLFLAVCLILPAFYNVISDLIEKDHAD